MRTTTVIRTMKTACGKTITYQQETGKVGKIHSVEGPALVYPKEEGKSAEYYLNGIKYSKSTWQSLISQQKVPAAGEMMLFDF